MGAIVLPNQPEAEPLIITEAMPDGSVRLMHTKQQPTGLNTFLAFMSDGTFKLQDSYGNLIMSTADGYIIVNAMNRVILSGQDVIVRDAPSGAMMSLFGNPLPT